MSFSDFLMPDDFPPFLRHGHLLRYFRMYADAFGLIRHVRFRAEVVGVRRTADFEGSGRWEVKWRRQGDCADGEVTEVFDAVLVCNGHDARQFVPQFEGRENFVGNVVHSHDYRSVVHTTTQRFL